MTWDRKAETKACEHADLVVSQISAPWVIKYFDPQYFPLPEIEANLERLRMNCDVASGKGGFVNSFYIKNLTGADTVYYFYEYQYKCGKIRYVMRYALEKDTFAFNFMTSEDATKPNPMIVHGQ